MSNYKIGELYRVINEHGDDVGLGVLLGVHEPWSLGPARTESPGLWNVSLLLDGVVGCYNTSCWTLIPAAEFVNS